jgi:hypothetical protein
MGVIKFVLRVFFSRGPLFRYSQEITLFALVVERA